MMEDSMVFIKTRKESRHIKTQLRQINKFNWLCQKNRGGHSNQQYGSSGGHASKQQLTAGETVEKRREMPSTTEDAINTTTTTKSMAKWVINISSRPLSTAQERLLAWGPNFAVVLREPPIVDCITEVEKVCQKLEQGAADELRGRIKTILKKAKTPRQNITKEECKAIGELKRDNNRLVLTADKGVALVVMDKEDYVQKARELLDQPTYKNISNDPTTKYKNKLVNLSKSIKSEGEIDEALCKKLYPTGAGSPKFYGLPKIHKEGNPWRPIVSSIGAASYEVAKELARILKPLVGKSMYHIHNTQDFIQQIKDMTATERSMHGFLWCQGTLHISAHKACHTHHQEAAWGRPRTPKRNNLVCNQHHQTIGVLPDQHLFYFPGQVLWTAGGSCNGIPHKSYCSKLVNG